MASDSPNGAEAVAKSREIPPWADGEGLRNVEKDVLIPRVMRERGRIICRDLVNDFIECAKGRTISMVWACRNENKVMKDCLTEYYEDPRSFEECKEIYLKDRESFQHEWQETGRTKRMKKKDVLV